MKKLSILCSLLSIHLAIMAQVSLTIDTPAQNIQVSPLLYGIFYEDINHAADGGLYAELIRDRSFEDEKTLSAAWSLSSSMPYQSSCEIIRSSLLNSAQKQALKWQIDASSQKPVSLNNSGFWGINVVDGQKYRLSFWAKGNYKGKLKACLSPANGKQPLAECQIKKRINSQWSQYTATLTAKGNDAQAQFQFIAEGKGTICLDVVSLFPPTFKGRENGCRPDLAQMLAELHPKFIRFPGGCYVEGKKSPENAFHWERTIGPIEERPGHMNVNWNYRTSDGLGFHEYLQLAEDLNAQPLYVVNVGIWHGGFTPVDSIQPWIDECLNALEYANGPITSKYGAMRAKNGHPQPFNIEYLEIGNENNQLDPLAQSDHYYERFKIFKDAILAKYPNMHLIGNVVAWADDNPMWRNQEPVELVDEHYCRDAKWFADNFHKYDSYPRNRHHIYVGEYAVTKDYGHMGSLNAALGEAIFMMGMENNSDIVKMASYAPIFANLHDRRWAPDMIQFNSEKAFGTPSYYVQKLIADHVGTRILNVFPSQSISNLFSSATLEENTGEIILKIVNRGKDSENVFIQANDKNFCKGIWHQLTSAAGSDENTIDKPQHVYPSMKTISKKDIGDGIEIPAYSLNIIRLWTE